jgi:prepilin-type N-terminal cleavage/methylation domain-containing protein
MKYFRGPKSGQRGFTLIELLVAIPISALVVAAATGGLIQVVNSKDASTHMYSLRQVQTAGYWVSTDAYQAQQVGDVPGEMTVGGNQGFPLVLKWEDPDTNEWHVVTYDLGGTPGESRTLERSEVITNQGTGDQTSATTTVASYLVDSIEGTPATEVKEGDPDAHQAPLIFKVTSHVGRERIQERTYDITLRPQMLAQVSF